MSRKYSYIFSRLVENDSDIVGHIAYALYKSDKVNYIEHFKEANKRDPSEDDLTAFHDVSSQPDSVKKYRFVASHILRGFLDSTLEDSLESIENDCNERHAEIIKDVITPLLPKKKSTIFWHGVLQSVAGAFIFALIVAAFVFIKSYEGA
ncbi:MAG: hypothetical protein NC418_02495 [Muribaculaceae bacterium]|nr:hypothetical protein [Muribaculaceae bacterium]